MSRDPIVRAARRLVLASVIVACGPRAEPEPAAAPAPAALPDPGRFEAEIQQLEAEARAHPPAPGGVLFVGSSSIRLWPTLAADFPGVPVVQRGFGGSTMRDVVHFAPRLVLPARPRLVVVYAGDNDLAEGVTPAQLLAEVQALATLVRRELPDTRLLVLSVKPSPARWALVEKQREANRLVRDYAQDTGGAVRYVDVFTPMLGPDGRPRPELFVEDGLHMTAAGYAIWRDVLAPELR